MDKLKLGDTVAYDEAMIDYQLIPQNFRQFVGQLVLMDDEAVGAETPSWLEVVQLVTYHYNGDVTIMTDEGSQTISKHKLVKHSGNYVAFYAIKPEVLNAPEVPPETVPESEVIVSEEYKEAKVIHNRIMANKQILETTVFELGRDLKTMRDGKLYKQFGYSNFEDYCQNEVKFTRRQAYKYLTIAERLPEDFVNSSSQIGVTKLSVIAMLDEPDRQALMETHDVENMTVKELKEAKAEIKKLKTEKEQLEDARRSKHQEWLNAMDEITTLTVQKSKLEEQVQELESRPVDMHSEKDAQKIKQLKEELEAVTEERDLKEKARLMLLHKWQESKEAEKALQKELDKLKAKPPETVTTEDTSRIEELKSKIEDLKQQLAEKPAVQESLSVSDGEFDAYFRMFDDALKHMTTYLFRKDCTDFWRRQSISMIETKFEKYISALKEERK